MEDDHILKRKSEFYSYGIYNLSPPISSYNILSNHFQLLEWYLASWLAEPQNTRCNILITWQISSTKWSVIWEIMRKKFKLWKSRQNGHVCKTSYWERISGCSTREYTGCSVRSLPTLRFGFIPNQKVQKKILTQQAPLEKQECKI